MRIGRGAKGSVPRPRCRARRARRWRARRRRRRRAAAPTSHPRGDGVTRTFKILTLFSRLTTSFGHHTERRTESEHRRDVRRGSLHLPRHPRRASVGVRRASSPDSERRSRAARSRPHRPRRRRPKIIMIFPPSPGVGSAPTSPRTRARGRTGSPTTRSPSSTPRWRPRRPPGSTSSTSPRTTSHSHPSPRDSMTCAPSSFTAAGSTSSKGFPSTGTRRGNDARCSTAWARTWAGRARRTRAVTSSGTSKI